MGQPETADPGATVRARARAAIAAGDQPGALILLRVLIDEGPEAAAALSPVVADALVATARSDSDARDRAARLAYQQAQAARVEICRLLECAPLDLDDLARIRMDLNDREQQLRAQSDERLRDRAIMGGAVGSRRLGNGWIERYWVGRRWGPYLRARWREAGRKRMKYVGKLPEQK
ncbi:MAG: hypothetical protein JO023_10295 [Chloroflexi bacterium]|nr:hypothetical protein [Chloroflexota bacterium]MBV9366816.1 hypothetical protein [Solirubrobacterales bacterium]